MDTWDNAQPDRDRPIDDGSASPDAGPDRPEGSKGSEGSERPDGGRAERAGETAGPVESPKQPDLPDLHRVLSAVADSFASSPQGDLYPQVMARAARIRRRRRAVRAGSATLALVMAAILGPSVASELGVRGGDASAAPPPSAIVDLTSAYPVPQPELGSPAVATPTQPENALAWPSRGAAVPAQAVDVAKSYLLNHATNPAGATVTTLWAQVDEDTTTPASVGHNAASKPVSQNAHKTWLYVMQGWTTAANGAPSQAQLLVGDYTQTGKTSSMSVYATPVTFAHVRPGSTDDTDDARQIAELSVWLPQSGRLVVLGAPQTRTVLYAKTGGDLIPQPTTDGVAVFPRTHRLVKGHYADTIQVRDANNVALTPPKAWSAADFQLTGAGSLWSSASGGWVKLPAHAGGRAPGTGTETAGPTAVSGTPTGGSATTGAVPGASPSSGGNASTAPSPSASSTGSPGPS